MKGIPPEESTHTEAKKNKHDNNNKHVTKQLGNNDPSSTLIMINFTPKSNILNILKTFLCCNYFFAE